LVLRLFQWSCFYGIMHTVTSGANQGSYVVFSCAASLKPLMLLFFGMEFISCYVLKKHNPMTSGEILKNYLTMRDPMCAAAWR